MTQDRREDRCADFDAVLSELYSAYEDGTYLQRGDLILSSDLKTPAAGKPQAEAKPAVGEKPKS
jgi:hypothetical protein